MLKRFVVKNFKNFKEELIFDLTNTRDYHWNDNLVKYNIINKAIIYGKNNSGKSNLGAAIMDITTHLSDNFSTNRLYNCYINGNSIENDVCFCYEFLFNNVALTYKYKKDRDRKLISEELSHDGKVIFKYNYIDNLYENNIEAAKSIDLSKRNQDISMLKYLYRSINYFENDHPLKLLFEYVNHMLWFRCLKENEFLGLMQGGEIIDDYIIKQGLLKQFEEFLKSMGQNYNLIEYENLGKSIIGVKYDRTVAPFSQVCSTGTSSLLLFFYWMKHSDKISFLYLDEFDAFYHYELSYNIVKYINNDSTYQAVLTTHNINLLDNDLMRPNCYYIIEKDKIESIDRKTKKTIRETHNLEKMYLGGEFVNE